MSLLNSASFNDLQIGRTENNASNLPFINGVINTSLVAPTSRGTSDNGVSILTASSNQTYEVPGFGFYVDNILTYPNDSIKLDIYNAADRFLESNLRVSDYSVAANRVTLNVEQHLSDLQYASGRYRVEYGFLRNFLGSGDGHKLRVQEISSNGLEIRVVPVQSNDLNNSAFLSFFSQRFFSLPKAQVLPNLRVFKSSTESLSVFDYIQDKLTFNTPPYSIILKLASPASELLQINDLVWIAQEVSNPLVDSITLTPPKLGSEVTIIAGPNWDVEMKRRTAVSTQYKDWDDLLSTYQPTTNELINSLFSGSLIEGIPLNIDFRDFNNYIHFGSAAERLLNFRYKLQLIEQYDARITELTTALDGLTSGSASSSFYYTNNVLDAKSKKNKLVGAFDTYEQYLYFNSSSYESSSYGEFYPTTWPKSNSTKPYVNFSVTSSEATLWFDGILSSASLFDSNNQNALYKTIPSHINENSDNEGYVLMVNMIGHYFDLIYAYVKQMTLTYDRNQSILDGFSKELIYSVAQNLGVDFENGTTLEDLWQYVLGTDVSGSYSSTYTVSYESRTKEVWKRIINNLPYLLRTKGTERGVRALINCFGIPQTILRVREFGGPEPEFNSRTDYTYERFFYSTEVGTPASYSINVPWRPLTESGGNLPNTVELRVKMHPSQSGDQTIMVRGAQWSVEAVEGSKLKLQVGLTSTTFTSSIYDGTFHHLSIVNDGSDITLYDRKTNYGKVVSVVSGSINTSAWGLEGDLQIPGTTNPFSGSVQELRFWSSALDARILDNHALAPTSFQGNDEDLYTGSTSSFYDLAFRLPLGADNNKVNYALTSSISSSHPNQLITTFSSGQQKTGSFINFTNTASIPHVEIHSLEWPDLGANRTLGNKIRIDNTIVAGENALYRNTSVLRSLTDNNPIDSPRLGVYLSPTDEVNQDIAEQFGGLSIDDFIGDPSYYELETYPALDQLQREYYKKYTWLPSGSTSTRNKPQNYIRLLKYYDAALFQLIKKFVPHRANTQVGLVIESPMIHRNKLPSRQPSWEDLTYSSSLEIPDIYVPGGFVQDGDGEPFRNMQGYVQEAVISVNQAEYLRPGGFVEDGDGEPFRNGVGYVEEGIIARSEDETPQPISPILQPVEYDYVIFDETIHASPNIGGDSFELLPSTVDLGISGYGRDVRVEGSQYTFFTYATSGSGSTRSEPYLVSSSRYDYSDPFGAVVLDSKRSEISNDASVPYDQDIFGGKAFDDYVSNTIILTSSIGIQQYDFTRQYGLRIVSGSWRIGTSGLQANSLGTASIDGFFYNQEELWTKDLIYDISFDITDSATGNLWLLEFGSLDSSFNRTYTDADTNVVSTVTRVSGPHLFIKRLFSGGNNQIRNLSIKCLNYRAQVQDYHLHNSKGMVNARYEGCKMTSADWNIDSPDTVDGGPVVTITLGGGNDLVTRPTARGTFEVRGSSATGGPTTTATRVASTNR